MVTNIIVLLPSTRRRMAPGLSPLRLWSSARGSRVMPAKESDRLDRGNTSSLESRFIKASLTCQNPWICKDRVHGLLRAHSHEAKSRLETFSSRYFTCISNDSNPAPWIFTGMELSSTCFISIASFPPFRQTPSTGDIRETTSSDRFVRLNLTVA